MSLLGKCKINKCMDIYVILRHRFEESKARKDSKHAESTSLSALLDWAHKEDLSETVHRAVKEQPCKTWEKSTEGKGMRNCKVPTWDFGTPWRTCHTHEHLFPGKAYCICVLYWTDCFTESVVTKYLIQVLFWELGQKVRWAVSGVWVKERS